MQLKGAGHNATIFTEPKVTLAMNIQIAKMIVIRGPLGISTLGSGRLLDLVNRFKCETSSAEFNSAWEALCMDKYHQPAELIGITYAD